MYDRRVTHSREADEILRENFGKLVYDDEDPQDDPLRRGPRQGLVDHRLRARRRGGGAVP